MHQIFSLVCDWSKLATGYSITQLKREISLSDIPRFSKFQLKTFCLFPLNFKMEHRFVFVTDEDLNIVFDDTVKPKKSTFHAVNV